MAGRNVDININGKDNARAAFKSAESSAKSFKQQISDLAKAPIRLGTGGIIGGLAFGALAKEAVTFSIKSAAGFEQTSVAFKTMLKDGGKAKDLLADISKFGAETPFQFTELADASKKLLAFGVASNDVLPSLRRLGDVASGIGIPIGELAEIYGKAKVQGRLFAEDINQLTGRGIPVIQELAKQFGVTDQEVKKLVESGSVGFKNLEAAFVSMTGKGGQFAGMMVEQSKTLVGQWSSLKDQIELAGRALGTKFLPPLKEAVEGLNALLGGQGGPEGRQPADVFKDPVLNRTHKDAAAGWMRLSEGDRLKEHLQSTIANDQAQLDKYPAFSDSPQKRAIQARIAANQKKLSGAGRVSQWDRIEANRAQQEHLDKVRERETPESLAAQNQLEAMMGVGRGLFMDGGLQSGTARAMKGIKGVFTDTFKGSFAGAGLLAGAKAKQAQAMTDIRNKIKGETATPQEKFDAEMEKLRGSREMLGDDLFNRKRRMLEDELSSTFGKNKRGNSFDTSGAPLVESRFLRFAPGQHGDQAKDPAERAANEAATTNKLLERQNVLLEAIVRKEQVVMRTEGL